MSRKPLYSRATIGGHPIHPMLIAFPVASYVGTLLGFVAYASTENAFWFRFGIVLNLAGVISALVAAIPGFIDWAFGVPNGRAKTDGLIHMMLNVLSLALFAICAGLNLQRWDQTMPDVGAGLGLSLIGVILTVAAGFFGWKMVQDHHVGVRLTPEQADLEPLPERTAVRRQVPIRDTP